MRFSVLCLVEGFFVSLFQARQEVVGTVWVVRVPVCFRVFPVHGQAFARPVLAESSASLSRPSGWTIVFDMAVIVWSDQRSD